MINRSLPSTSYECYDLETKKTDAPICDPLPDNISGNPLLEVIEATAYYRYEAYKNNSHFFTKKSLRDMSPSNHRKWKLQINDYFKSITESSIISFAKKLDEINCGSLEEKKDFLYAVSKEIAAYYPFKMINDLMIEFTDREISKVVLSYAEKEIEDISNNDTRNYNELDEIIPKKVKENLLKEDNKLELISCISSEITESHEKLCTEEKIKLPFNAKKMPFVAFFDLYLKHLIESYDFIISKSTSVFDNLGHDKECCISFVFDTIFEKRIIRNESKQILSIVIKNTAHGIAYDLKKLLENSLISGKIEFFSEYEGKGYHIYGSTREYYTDFTKVIVELQKKLECEIVSYLTKNNIILIEDVVTVCNKKIMKEIVSSSTKHLEKELRASIIDF